MMAMIVYGFEREATDRKEVKTFEGSEDRQQTPRPWRSLYIESSLPGPDSFTHLVVEIHDVFRIRVVPSESQTGGTHCCK